MRRIISSLSLTGTSTTPNAELTVTQNDPTAFGFLLVSLGAGNLPLPFGTLLIDVFTYAGSFTMNGGAPMNVGATAFQIAVPLDPTLNGAGPVNFQNINIVPGSPNQLSLSNGQEFFLAF